MGQVTISGTNATVFGSLAGATTYFALALGGTGWSAASGTDRQKALVSATRWMQRLGLVDPSDGSTIVPDVADAGVPVPVQEGAYELADALLTDAEAQAATSTGSNVKSVKAGSAEVTFFRATNGTPLPTVAFQLLRPYLASQQSTGDGDGGVGSYASGTDGESSFSDGDAWGRYSGFP